MTDSTTTNNTNTATTNEPTHEDLIKRYNLQNRVHQPEQQPVDTPENAKARYEWSKQREVREKTLRRRKEEAVLAARRKMQEAERPVDGGR